MNRPFWLDIVYIAGGMTPPVIASWLTVQWLQLSGMVGLFSFIGILLVGTILWLGVLVTWSRFTKSSDDSGTGT